MRNYKDEFEGRVAYIKELVKSSGVKGIVYGNSGGKDCALVGILSKMSLQTSSAVLAPQEQTIKWK